MDFYDYYYANKSDIKVLDDIIIIKTPLINRQLYVELVNMSRSLIGSREVLDMFKGWIEAESSYIYIGESRNEQKVTKELLVEACRQYIWSVNALAPVLCENDLEVHFINVKKFEGIVEKFRTGNLSGVKNTVIRQKNVCDLISAIKNSIVLNLNVLNDKNLHYKGYDQYKEEARVYLKNRK